MSDNSFNNKPEEQEEDWVSKTEIKRQVKEITAIGESLCILSNDQLKQVKLDGELLAAVIETRRIKPRTNAMKRHMGYLGRLLRCLSDDELTAVKSAADRFDASKQAHTAFFHKLERWRDQLVEGGNEKLQEFLSEFPDTDIQHLRQLVRNAKKEADGGKNTGAGKKLFQFLRSLAEV